MIDFGLCRKCESCEVWEPGEEAEFNGKGVKPSVSCKLAEGDILLMNSYAPKDCPYALEHKLVTQNVPVGFANYMSGCRRSK